jgi:hypothetical protein
MPRLEYVTADNVTLGRCRGAVLWFPEKKEWNDFPPPNGET